MFSPIIHVFGRVFLWGRELLQKGNRWPVRSGLDIEIYTNNWIHQASTLCAVSPRWLSVDSSVERLISSGNC